MTCPICNDRFIIATAGPDEFGNYDTEDCPCQVVPDFDAEAFLAERDAEQPHWKDGDYPDPWSGG